MRQLDSYNDFHIFLKSVVFNILSKSNITFAEMDDDGSLDFPIGRHVWEFSHGFCGREKQEEYSLTLSQCAENKEFTCDDGTCISLDEVSNNGIFINITLSVNKKNIFTRKLLTSFVYKHIDHFLKKTQKIIYTRAQGH